ncbi:hypothetical protein [Streptomyces sp. KLOTTS4A1]|uniref:hypothetical protein n=1 Tax=Streptomyces sp. KLOTTS4A1 TaxID=3390996 RepID=UPI0039F51128
MLGRVRRRLHGRLWPVVQQAVACALSWWLAGCTSLARLTADSPEASRGPLIRATRALAQVLEACASAPEGSAGRRGCVRAALAAAAAVPSDAGTGGDAVRLVVRDLLVVAGLSVSDAAAAVRDGAADAPLTAAVPL